MLDIWTCVYALLTVGVHPRVCVHSIVFLMWCEVLDSGWPDKHRHTNAPARKCVSVAHEEKRLAWGNTRQHSDSGLPALHLYVVSLVFTPSNSGRSSSIRHAGTPKDSFIHDTMRSNIPSMENRSPKATSVKFQTSVALCSPLFLSALHEFTICLFSFVG